MMMIAIAVLVAAFFAGVYLADVVQDRNAWRRATEQARQVMRRREL